MICLSSPPPSTTTATPSTLAGVDLWLVVREWPANSIWLGRGGEGRQQIGKPFSGTPGKQFFFVPCFIIFIFCLNRKCWTLVYFWKYCYEWFIRNKGKTPHENAFKRRAATSTNYFVRPYLSMRLHVFLSEITINSLSVVSSEHLFLSSLVNS